MKRIKYADGRFSQQHQDTKSSYYFQRNCGVRFQYADIENLLKKQKEGRKKQLNIILECGCQEKRATILFYLNLFCYLCRQTTKHKNTVQFIERLIHQQCQPNFDMDMHRFNHRSTKQQKKDLKMPQLDKIETKEQDSRTLQDYEQIKVILKEIQEKDEEFNVPKVQTLNIRDDKDDIYMECSYCHSIMKGLDIHRLLNFQWKTIFPLFACLICIHTIKKARQLKQKQHQEKTSLKDIKKRQNEGQFEQPHSKFDHRLSHKKSPLEISLKQKQLYSTRIKQSKFTKLLPDFYTKPEFPYTGKGLSQLYLDAFRGKL